MAVITLLKGYVTTISCRHALVHDATLSLDPSIRRWIKCLEDLKGIHIYDNACLVLVLAALKKALFEPIRTCCLNLTWKMAFLLAITYGCTPYAASHCTYGFPMLESPSS